MDRHISKNPLTLLQPVATMPTAYNEINGFLGSMSDTQEGGNYYESRQNFAYHPGPHTKNGIRSKLTTRAWLLANVKVREASKQPFLTESTGGRPAQDAALTIDF